MTSEKNKYVSLFTKFVNNADRISEDIKNNTSSLTDNITKLDSLLEDIDLGNIKVFLPPKNTILESWKRWQKYLEEKDINIFSENDIYNLTFDYNILNNEEFWNVLKNNKFITEKILFALVRNIHYYWTDINNFKNVILSVEKYLKNIKTDKKIINKWQKNPEYILGSSHVALEKILLMAINNNIINLPTLYKDKVYNLQKNDLLSNIIQYEYLSNAISTKNFTDQLEYYFNLCLEFFNYSMKPSFRNEDTRQESQSLNAKRDSLLAELIIKINTISQYNEEYKLKLIDFVVNMPIYGDPRLKEWKDYKHTQAMGIIKTWLNERDIAFFFENLIDEDPHDRRGFWLSKADKIDYAMFVLGNDVPANSKNSNQINQFKQFASKNIHLIGDEDNLVKSNIFILKMGEIVAIEFSETNNACFIYRYEDYQKEINPLLQTRMSRASMKLANFKNENMYIERFTHDPWGTWQKKVEIFLSQHI